jgi:hypothetical protein
LKICLFFRRISWALFFSGIWLTPDQIHCELD